MPRKPRDRSKYRNRPYGSGTCVQRGDGWEARWSEGGKRRSKMFATEQDCDEFLMKIWMEKRRGTYREPSQMTVAELVSSWIERRKDSWAASTYALNKHYLDDYVAPALGSIRAVELHPSQVQHMVDTMRNEGRSAVVIRQSVRVLSSAYIAANKLQILTGNPAANLTLPRYTPRTRKTWNAAEIERVDAYLQDDPKWLAVYRVCLSAGIRPGEMIALKWGDLDLPNRRVHIQRTVTKSAGGRSVIGKTTKTGRTRVLALSVSAVEALKAWRIEQTKQRLAAPHWNDQDLVLTGKHGDLVHQSTWFRFHRELCERAQVSVITVHGLRHTFATVSMEQRIHPLVVKEMLGHKSITMTLDLYSHVDLDLQAAASEALDAHLFRPENRQKGHS